MATPIEYLPTIKEMPASERPRERLQAYGEGALSTSELIAILLRTGMEGQSAVNVASRLLHDFGLAGLARGSFDDLASVKGLGPAKVAQLKAAFELGRRLSAEAPDELPQIRCPADAANLVLSEMGVLEQEHLRTLLLDTKNRVLAKREIYVGSLNTSLIRVGELFRPAIHANSAAIIVVHNHPSGDPTPSPEDVAVTRQIVEAGKLLDIEVLDHLIIGWQRWVSLKERGLGFS
ncbi:MAG: DNA repair protein RadC [Anaerolineae bacterium]|nr:DNA repair protein RadC [Anaerolineae bacterium]